MNTINIIENALKLVRYNHPADQEAVEKCADQIGPVSRELYLDLVRSWKKAYSALAVDARDTKAKRKGGTPEAMAAIERCKELRTLARSYMIVRHALKELARRHASKKAETEAA